uniref:Uncharacterized protein n=1 Tax=Anguilla anguilla TaxID=7936 RepID=A0A0E9XGW6_ANGAN
MELALRCLAVFSCVSLVFLPDPPTSSLIRCCCDLVLLFSAFFGTVCPGLILMCFCLCSSPVPAVCFQICLVCLRAVFSMGLDAHNILHGVVGSRVVQEKVGHDPLER